MLSCIGCCLKYTKDQLTPDQWESKEKLRLTVKLLKVDIVDLSEQQLFQELRKVSHTCPIFLQFLLVKIFLLISTISSFLII